ncbi:kinase [Ktedonosporobacter rubrisoli]|uniref:Kinase n=1 Tax=Ktedonosporobacter rubrisoli TaxID=2509675 RepID=A0A4P6JPP2_KTERU|nr:kinase [Ktedonosporobacter rubrisoli]QBD77255.1 kinase [Ktedonosporobacter rubrisoli]
MISGHLTAPGRDTSGRLIGTGKAFGTFGELLQGSLGPEHNNFLVTFPIDCYSYATFIAEPDNTRVSVWPDFKWKAQTLATAILKYYHLQPGGKLKIVSELPVGKGLASSSADLVATARAIASCFHLSIPLALLEQWMQQIEPSDGVMYPGIAAFYHQQVRLHTFFGNLPSLTIIGLDEGGSVDTIAFNHYPKPFTQEEVAEYKRLLEMTAMAVRQQDLASLGYIATRSAQLNQALNPKRTLKNLQEICQSISGLGVIVAHSGTCLGLLLSPQYPAYREQLRQAYDQISDLASTVLVYHSLCCVNTTLREHIS